MLFKCDSVSLQGQLDLRHCSWHEIDESSIRLQAFDNKGCRGIDTKDFERFVLSPDLCYMVFYAEDIADSSAHCQ